LDQKLTTKYNSADLLLLHSTYNHSPNALMPPPLTVVDNIDDVNKQHPAGRDKSKGREA
jgi:hypothetical protein